jgi:hypothetical protein
LEVTPLTVPEGAGSGVPSAQKVAVPYATLSVVVKSVGQVVPKAVVCGVNITVPPAAAISARAVWLAVKFAPLEF